MSERRRSLAEGPWQGRVVEINDPLNQRRIRVEVPDVLGGSTSTWATAKDSHALYRTPSVGDGVWVEFQQGDIDRPVWTGGYVGAPFGGPLSGADALQPDKVVLIVTPGGQQLKLSDLPDTGGLVLTSAGGARIEVTDAGITIDNGKGARIELRGTEVSINDGALSVM